MIKSPTYRLTLTSSQITYLTTLCKSSPSRESIEILKKLEVYGFKISNGITKPAYIASPPQSLEDKLGFSESSTIAEEVTNTVALLGLWEESKQLYHRWLESPSTLSAKEIGMVMDYKYGEGLMTPGEKERYEEDNGLVFPIDKNLLER